MHVDLAEQTLSKDVENAMEMIDELKEISAGTRVINCENITFLVTAEMKSVNYGTSNHTEMDLNYLSRYDYRKKSTKNNDIRSNLLDHAKHLSNMSSFIQRIFKGLLMDDLFMGKIEIPTSSFNTEINQQNQRIFLFQGNLWTTTWISHLETCLNNYLCSGIWFQQFQEIIIPHSQSSLMTKRLVAYFLINRVLEETIRGDHCENKSIQEQADPTLIPKTIITLNQVEASKFSYIVSWMLFKLIKRDYLMNSHPKFSVMCILLRSLCTEKVEYVLETKSQTTIIIPGTEFIQFMYRLESLVIELFEKHNELGSNILRYVENSLLTNLHLNQTFIQILKSSNGENNSELENEDCKFIYEKCVLIYMKSRQKTWRSVNNYILEKETANLQESLKVMNHNHPTTALNENKKPTIIKKVNLPTNPIYALEQLRIWAQLEGAEESFAKMFIVLELLWLVRAFGVSTAYKRKQKLVPIVISNLKNKTLFIKEALEKNAIFME
ncbi:hypothetical protein RhiirA5_385327 [Rhizophagus irregularis]|uniref:Uncharacterized protein n=1 Tax=Rhizophagus irregularis TaxID=588596 RepID=A0A2N0NPF6_9GLOM|nr:hypothetical protein RhiirA5_385327 [Rhizophagus irregularis]